MNNLFILISVQEILLSTLKLLFIKFTHKLQAQWTKGPVFLFMFISGLFLQLAEDIQKLLVLGLGLELRK